MAVARKLLTLIFAFAAMALGIEGLRRAVDWWRGDLAAPTITDWALIMGLPLIIGLWWRYVSPFGKGRGQCLMPPAKATGDDPPAPANRE
jgi:hypothetical protein